MKIKLIMKKLLLLIVCCCIYEFNYAQCSLTLNGATSPFFVCTSELPLPIAGCEGGTFDATPGVLPDGTGTGTATLGVVAGGVYTLSCTLPDGTVCTETVVVNEPDQVPDIINPTLADAQYCGNETQTVTLQGNLDGNTNASFTINGSFATEFVPADLGEGSHTIEYIYLDPTNGCTNTDILVFFVNPAPDMTISGLEGVYCVNAPPATLGSDVLTGSTFEGVGVNSLGTFDPALAGVGTHEITHYYSDFVCADSLTVTVEVVDALVLDFTASGSACYTETDTIIYTGDVAGEGAIYNWTLSDGDIIQNLGDTILVNWPDAGDYNVELNIDDVFCTPLGAVSQTITKHTLTVATIDDLAVEQFQSVPLTAEATATYTTDIAYSWSPATGLSCTDCASPIATPEQTTTYTVTATTPDGCTATDEVTITLVDDRSVFVPNIFTPNEDGKNDVLYLLGKGIETIDMSIYDRYGSKIFQTTDINVGWDGKYSRQRLNSGVYLWVAEVTFYDGQIQQYSGNVTLVR